MKIKSRRSAATKSIFDFRKSAMCRKMAAFRELWRLSRNRWLVFFLAAFVFFFLTMGLLFYEKPMPDQEVVSALAEFQDAIDCMPIFVLSRHTRNFLDNDWQEDGAESDLLLDEPREVAKTGYMSALFKPLGFEQVLQEEFLRALRTRYAAVRDGHMGKGHLGLLPVSGLITSRYGLRSLYRNGQSPRVHSGIDIAASTGTPVFCMWPGIVTRSGWYGNYGYMIEVYHGKNIVTRYAHLSKILVTPKKFVSRGDVLGRVGSTGRSTGPHLHFEMRYKNKAVNPLRYILLEYMEQKRG